MTREATRRRIFDLFGELLEYPHPGLAASVRECEVLLSSSRAEAATVLSEFRRFLEGAFSGHVEESFSGAFDLDAACYPYVGYHLFGESYKRSVFMLGLKERYRDNGFTMVGCELPDHIAVILRFLAVCQDSGLAQELVEDALLPTLRQLVGKGDDELAAADEEQVGPRRRIVYYDVLRALRLFLLSLTTGGQHPPPNMVETLAD